MYLLPLVSYAEIAACFSWKQGGFNPLHLLLWVKSYRNSATGWKGLIQGQAVDRTSWFAKPSAASVPQMGHF